jgi:hypothetical protein
MKKSASSSTSICTSLYSTEGHDSSVPLPGQYVLSLLHARQRRWTHPFGKRNAKCLPPTAGGASS